MTPPQRRVAPLALGHLTRPETAYALEEATIRALAHAQQMS